MKTDGPTYVTEDREDAETPPRERPAREPSGSGGSEKQRRHAPVRKIAIWGPLLVVALLAALAVFGVWRHVQERNAQEDFAKKTSGVTVNVVTVHRDAKPHELILPANVAAFETAEIYARASGYLAKWYVDIGDKVKEGQLLAEIEAPDIDAQLRQAVANLGQARANLEIARLSFVREKELVDKKVISQQEYDQARTTFDAQEAAVRAGEASVQNLQAQQGFEKITAPFNGTITTRAVDIGALVSAGSGTTGTPLFGIAQNDPLRVYTNVPQSNVPSIRDGLAAKLIVREYPGKEFGGAVTRVAGALDAQSRTLLVEVDIPNPDDTLYSGMYGQAKFTLTDPDAPIILSSNAFVFNASGPQVATVTKENRIHWQKIQVGRDFGTQMEVPQGLQDNATVVMNPSDDLTEGLQVTVKTAPLETPSAPSAAGAKR